MSVTITGAVGSLMSQNMIPVSEAVTIQRRPSMVATPAAWVSRISSSTVVPTRSGLQGSSKVKELRPPTPAW